MHIHNHLPFCILHLLYVGILFGGYLLTNWTLKAADDLPSDPSGPRPRIGVVWQEDTSHKRYSHFVKPSQNNLLGSATLLGLEAAWLIWLGVRRVEESNRWLESQWWFISHGLMGFTDGSKIIWFVDHGQTNVGIPARIFRLEWRERNLSWAQRWF